MSSWLTVLAWTELLFIDVLLRVWGFRAVKQRISRTRTRHQPGFDGAETQVVAALDRACLLYVKPALCLQRAAVATRLLRRLGVPADLVIGCRRPPVTAHAWVEVAGRVVSENISTLHLYHVLDRW